MNKWNWSAVDVNGYLLTDPPKNGFFFFIITRIVVPICFQRALNYHQVVILSRDISKNVFWAPDVQIW